MNRKYISTLVRLMVCTGLSLQCGLSFTGCTLQENQVGESESTETQSAQSLLSDTEQLFDDRDDDTGFDESESYLKFSSTETAAYVTTAVSRFWEVL